MASIGNSSYGGVLDRLSPDWNNAAIHIEDGNPVLAYWNDRHIQKDVNETIICSKKTCK